LNKYLTTTKSSGFSLIELLVVVAILGVISAIGVVSYSGYVESTKRKSAENVMRQVSLGQTEYYSENSIYSTSGSTCTATIATSEAIETNLLGGSQIIIDANAKPKKKSKSGYLICVQDHASGYEVKAVDESNSKGCTLTLTAGSSFKKTNC
jgi:type IV pilus assembly protein PilE